MLQLWFFDSVVGNHMRAYRRKQNKYGLDNESYHVWGLVELREPCTKVLSQPYLINFVIFLLLLLLFQVFALFILFFGHISSETHLKDNIYSPHI